MALVFSTEQLRNLLITPAVRWLGKISYSLYLLHGTVLYSLYRVFWPSGNHVVVLSVGVLLSLTLSAVFYRWVEVPSMQIGRDVAGALQRSKETPVLQAS